MWGIPVPPAPARRVNYIPEADAHDVLREQLAYLFDHRAAHGSPTCRKCRRFERVRKILMKPFEERSAPKSK